ncbi:MAG TPA: thiosulfate oxidation carrier complex protein SoxZ [Sulfurihydrogenibium azorense]|uniref:Thiosulfate oxidation carrier complex protein SoxZ n=1 Tax=Sulfurihydrogenibium azorense TaxID=309806 RepID=A0A831YAH9_9AQUI|nr:MAG: thiosulfate oxidation carrier complex protein SoxZ [Sulfurihydrogenibium sp.]HEV08787.1 thiosulfate oxidation carrier complex protein SoxZ [Sulfurihydrogenibium azorense]
MARQALVKINPKDYKKGDLIRVDSVIMHPMDTGLVKDKESGKYIAAHYITNVEVYYGDEKITWMDLYGSVSANPFISFYVKATKTAPLKIVWKDNKGEVTEKVIDIKVD